MRFVGLIVLITGCGVGSVQPLHRDSDLLFDRQLVGTWDDSAGKESAVLTADSGRAYRLTYRDGEGKTGLFHARLGQLGSRRVLDVQPEDPSFDVSDVYKSLVLPLHGFVFIEVQGQVLRTAVLKADTLRRYLERNPTAVPHVALKDVVLLTAPSSELRRFFTGYVARPGALDEATIWRLRSPQMFGPRDVDALPSRAPQLVARYGTDSLQFGELRLPVGAGPFPVAVVIHGGCWTAGFATLRNTAPLANALVEQGIATWNIEYRQVGNPGAGWPGTFLDVGAGIDHLRNLAKQYPLDLGRVILVGHSAGAHMALWGAGRPRLPTDSPIRGQNPLPVAGAVAIDGPGDLIGFVGPDGRVCRRPVIAALMGGPPTTQAERYRQGSPQELLPIGVPQYLVAAQVLSVDDARRYQSRGRALGDSVSILPVTNGNHFDVIAPGRIAWPAVLVFLRQAFDLSPSPPRQ